MNRWISTPLLVVTTLIVFGVALFYLDRNANPQYLDMVSNVTSIGLDAGKNLKSGNCDVFIGDHSGAGYTDASYVYDITATMPNDRDMLVHALLTVDDTLLGTKSDTRLDRPCAKLYRTVRTELENRISNVNAGGSNLNPASQVRLPN